MRTRHPERFSQRLPVLDERSPLLRGLLFAGANCGLTSLDLVSTKLGARTGTARAASPLGGEGPMYGAGSYVDFAAPSGLDATQPTTIAWEQQPRGPTGYNTILFIRAPLNSTHGFLILQAFSDSASYFIVGPRSGGTGPNFSTAIGPATSLRCDRFVLTLAAGMASGAVGGYVLWRNGVRYTTASTGTFSANTTAGFRLGANDSGANPHEGYLGRPRIWQRVLDDEECRAWSLGEIDVERRRRVDLAAAPVVSALSGDVMLDDVIAAGTLSSSASDLSGGVVLDDVAPAGVLGVAPGVVTINAVRNENNGLQAGITIPYLTFQRMSDRSQALVLADQVTDGGGNIVVTNAALISGEWYVVTAWHPDRSKAGVWFKQAA